MDQTLSLSQSPASSSPRTVQASGASASGVTPSEEEPESPGRSPRQHRTHAAGSDPLAEGMSIILGIALGLIAVLVPLTTVLLDSQPSGGSEAVNRPRW